MILPVGSPFDIVCLYVGADRPERGNEVSNFLSIPVAFACRRHIVQVASERVDTALIRDRVHTDGNEIPGLLRDIDSAAVQVPLLNWLVFRLNQAIRPRLRARSRGGYCTR